MKVVLINSSAVTKVSLTKCGKIPPQEIGLDSADYHTMPGVGWQRCSPACRTWTCTSLSTAWPCSGGLSWPQEQVRVSWIPSTLAAPSLSAGRMFFNKVGWHKSNLTCSGTFSHPATSWPPSMRGHAWPQVCRTWPPTAGRWINGSSYTMKAG